MPLSKNAQELILSREGIDQPWEIQPSPSGVSLGRGHDLRFDTTERLREAWSPHLTAEQLQRLSAACGKVATIELCRRFRDIQITAAAADEVFNRYDLPRYEAQTEQAFPGCDQLPADAYGALVSLVYNRGPATQGDSRREMKEIRIIIASETIDLSGKLEAIAQRIRSMKRLWPTLEGLRDRRDAEAALVESCIPAGA